MGDAPPFALPGFRWDPEYVVNTTLIQTYSNTLTLGRNAFSEIQERSTVPRRHQNRTKPLVLRCSKFRAVVSRPILDMPET